MSVFVSSTQRVSVSTSGQEGDQASGDARLSSDGRVLAFFSNAGNLVTGDANGTTDLFFRNLETGQTFIANWDGRIGYGPQFSADGSKLGFMSFDGAVNHIFVAAPATGVITEVSASADGASANATSGPYAFSPDGGRIAFASAAGNLVSGDAGLNDIFIKTLSDGGIVRISINAAGEAADGDSSNPVFSPDGHHVAFASAANNLAPSSFDPGGGITEYFIKNLDDGSVSIVPGGQLSAGPVFSADGSKILFASTANGIVSGDTDNQQDYFVQNLGTGTVSLVGNGQVFVQPPQFSPDGGAVFFTSPASLVPGDTNGTTDVFLQNLATGVITRLSTNSDGSQGTGASTKPVLSADGSKLVFTSPAPEFATGDDDSVADFYVKNLETGVLSRIAMASAAIPVFSPDGSKLFFGSAENGLVADDADGTMDYFIRDLVSGTVVKVVEGDHIAGFPIIADDWSQITFVSDADDIVPNDTNGEQDVFVSLLGDDTVLNGTDGDNTINGDGDAETINGFGGKDKLNGNGGDDILHGGDGNDVMNGGTGRDTLYGESDIDTIHGNEDNDKVYGGTGDDKLYGDDGDDSVYGDENNDFMGGGAGNDDMHGGEGNDTVYGNEGNDRVEGDAGNDTLYGGDGNDIIRGGSDDDLVYGNGGTDDMNGDAGNDTLYGGSGNDILLGDSGETGGGNDTLCGETGNDTLRGGADADTLNGGAGADTLYGDAEADTFAFDTATLGAVDRIKDFVAGDGDRLDVSDLLIDFDPLTDAIAKFVKITTNGEISALYVDRNGGEAGMGFEKIAVLENNNALNVQDLYNNAQIVV